MSRLTLDMTTETPPSTALFVNFDDEFATKIDMSPIHAGGVERQRHITFSIDRDQSTAAAALFSFLNFLERVPPFLREEIFLIDKLYSVFLREDFGTFAIHHDVSRFFHDQPRQAHWVLNVLQTRDRAGLERISVHDGRVQF